MTVCRTTDDLFSATPIVKSDVIVRFGPRPSPFVLSGSSLTATFDNRPLPGAGSTWVSVVFLYAILLLGARKLLGKAAGRKKKRSKFRDVQVREYNVTLGGDRPWGRGGGVPPGLDWVCAEARACSLDAIKSQSLSPVDRHERFAQVSRMERTELALEECQHQQQQEDGGEDFWLTEQLPDENDGEDFGLECGGEEEEPTEAPEIVPEPVGEELEEEAVEPVQQRPARRQKRAAAARALQPVRRSARLAAAAKDPLATASPLRAPLRRSARLAAKPRCNYKE
jgi:hypothetical protein